MTRLIEDLFSAWGVACDDNMSVMSRIPDYTIDLIMTSPPYPGARGASKMSVPQWYNFMGDRFNQFVRILKASGVFVLNVMFPTHEGWFDWRTFDLIPFLRTEFGFDCVDTYIWVKTNPVPVGDLRARDIPAWEPVFVFAKSKAYLAHFTPVRKPYSIKTLRKLVDGNKTRSQGVGHNYVGGHDEPHRLGARQTNVLAISSSGDQNRPRAQGGSFPRALPRRFIQQYTKPKDIVFDPFAGVFTTIHEARRLGRVGFGCDIDRDECRKGEEWLSGTWQPSLI